MRQSKQVIVMRTDLNMRRGKQIAQGAHASLKVVLDEWLLFAISMIIHMFATNAISDWLFGSFTKICCQTKSEEELLELYAKAKKAGLPCALILDAGRTEFDDKPTYTCIAIGPAWSDKIDPITKDLKLL